MKRSEFADYVVEDLLRELRGVAARAMFGGHGLYKDGIIFGIIADEVLYFKVDDSNRAQYEAMGSRPFTYTARNNKKAVMSYWEVPVEVMEDAGTLAEWALASIKISQKIQKRRKKEVNE